MAEKTDKIAQTESGAEGNPLLGDSEIQLLLGHNKENP